MHTTTPTPHDEREALAYLLRRSLHYFAGIHTVSQAKANPGASRLLRMHAVLHAQRRGPYAGKPHVFDAKAAAAGELIHREEHA